MQKWSDHADVAKVKEAYSILSNAFKMAMAENGTIDEWDKTITSSHSKMTTKIAEYLKVVEVCHYNTPCLNYGWQQDGSWSNTQPGALKELNGNVCKLTSSCGRLHQNHLTYFLKNGMYFTVYETNTEERTNTNLENYMGVLWIDINGKAKPNRLGYDVFRFYWNKNGLLPTIKSTSANNIKGNCDTKQNNSGYTCSSWIMLHNNMDYKYRDIPYSEWKASNEFVRQ